MLYVFNNIKRKEVFDSVINKDNDLVLAISNLINFGIEEGLSGNLWKKYILYTFIFNDNSYTRAIERNKCDIGYSRFVESDFKYFYDLYNMDTKSLGEANDFKIESTRANKYLKLLIENMINEIKDNDYNSFKNTLLKFYKEKGLAYMALFKAFRVDNGNLKPIKNVLDVTFDDLIGYDMQKNMLCENTEAFISGKPFNNVLLYGDSGTGKSTSIKALINKYFDKGLRIIEVYKHQMEEISKIIHTLRTRPYYYIIYMDDLSFEENEVEYKYLKSIIEGGIEPKPDNVVVYATSNRRHLIKETFRDNGTIDDDLNRSETQAEKLSLAYRFGLQIYYSNLSPMEFKKMVKALAIVNNINIDDEVLYKEASSWQLRYGSLSGRCATQFVSYLINKVVK